MGGYEHCDSFEQPARSERLWRYLDFAKFVDMLDMSALHFGRADTMGDPWEGALSSAMEEADIRRMREAAEAYIGHSAAAKRLGIEYVDDDPEQEARLLASHRETWRANRRRVFLSCWYRANHESAAMWGLYCGRDGRGLAIQTTFGRLERALPDACPHRVHLANVEYTDYQRRITTVGNGLQPFLRKRRHFEHEHELRGLFKVTGLDDPPPGLNVPVDLVTLIERVHVAPNSPPWFAALVERTVSRYGINAETLQSDLLIGPLE